MPNLAAVPDARTGGTQPRIRGHHAKQADARAGRREGPSVHARLHSRTGGPPVRFYVIRHRATGELMPQPKNGRGYSHWNPGAGRTMTRSLGVPRLMKDA